MMEIFVLILMIILAIAVLWITLDPLMTWSLNLLSSFRPLMKPLDNTFVTRVSGIIAAILGFIILVLLIWLIFSKG